jgi:ubiquinone biosynthesis protein
MGISLKPQHLGRYRAMAALLLKYGRSDLVRESGLDAALSDREEHGASSHDQVELADQLAEDLEKMGPTYIKLGQLLSTRADVLPPAYLEALGRLQDDVDPFDYEDVERIVEADLGVRISKAFTSFDPEPLAAASLGQVHRATLRSGRLVAVKVQRPDVRQQVDDDLDALQNLADFADRHTDAGRRIGFRDVLDQFRQTITRELDYAQEVSHLATFARNMSEFERIVVPEPVMDFTSTRVLTMDFIRGRKITDMSPLLRMEIDGDALADELFRAYLKQVLVDGVFHADPHPGNILLTEDHRLAMLDLGMLGFVSPALQEDLLRLLLGIADGRGEEVADISLKIGHRLQDYDPDSFRRRVAQLVASNRDANVNDIDVGRVVMEISRAATEGGVRLPAELTMLSKTLLNLDRIATALSPDFDGNAAVQRNAAEIMRKRLRRTASPANLAASALEMGELLQRLPARLNSVFDRLARDEISLRIRAIDEEALISGIEKVANRITMGLVLAALIVGAAMLMQVQTDFTILGYPGIAMLLFGAAVIGGIAMVLDIIVKDRRRRERTSRRAT